MRFKHQTPLVATGFLVASLVWMTVATPGLAKAAAQRATTSASTSNSWTYPVAAQEVFKDYSSPNGDYSAGHRGIDFLASEGEMVLAVTDGEVRFSGQVAGRGVVSIALADGYVAEVEPICANVAEGEIVSTGQPIGTVCDAQNPHCPETCLHLSARKFSAEYSRGFAYLNPLLFFESFKLSHLVAVGSLT